MYKLYSIFSRHCLQGQAIQELTGITYWVQAVYSVTVCLRTYSQALAISGQQAQLVPRCSLSEGMEAPASQPSLPTPCQTRVCDLTDCDDKQ